MEWILSRDVNLSFICEETLNDSYVYRKIHLRIRRFPLLPSISNWKYAPTKLIPSHMPNPLSPQLGTWPVNKFLPNFRSSKKTQKRNAVRAPNRPMTHLKQAPVLGARFCSRLCTASAEKWKGISRAMFDSHDLQAFMTYFPWRGFFKKSF